MLKLITGSVVLIASFLTVTAPATAAPATDPQPNEAYGYVTTTFTEKVYDTQGHLLKVNNTAPDSSSSAASEYLIESATAGTHASTGCHSISGTSTKHSLLGFTLWRYRVGTYSCWNKYKRLVYNVSNHRRFVDVSEVDHVDDSLIRYVHYFYNPTNTWDPFPLPGLNGHSAYYHLSQGEIVGPCISPSITCHWRPWGSIKSLYSGNWIAKADAGQGEDTKTTSG